MMQMMPGMIGGEGSEEELGLLLHDQWRHEVSDRERELNLYRSGSAPPTIEGSLAAASGIFGGAAAGEEELRSNPAYLSYYYSNAKLNPRLPPPVLSKEDWRFSQRLHAGGSVIGERRKAGREEEWDGSSLFSPFDQKPAEDEGEAPGSGEWFDRGGNGLIGLPGISLVRQKSLAGIFQDDYSSRPTSHDVFSIGIEPLGSLNGSHPHVNGQSVDGVQNNGLLETPTFSSVLGISRPTSTNPDLQLVAKVPSPCLPPIGTKLGNNDKKNPCSYDGASSGTVESDDLVAALSNMSLTATGEVDKDIFPQWELQQEMENHQKLLFDSQSNQSDIKQRPFSKKSDSGYSNVSSIPNFDKSGYPDIARKNKGFLDLKNSAMRPNGYVELRKPTLSSVNTFLGTRAPLTPSPGRSPAPYLDTNGANAAFVSYGLSGYSAHPGLSSTVGNQFGTGNFPPLFENAAAAAASTIGTLDVTSRGLAGFPSGLNLSGVSDLQNHARLGNQTAVAALQMSFMDPLYAHYLKTAEYAQQAAAYYSDPSIERGYVGNSYAELHGIQKAYLDTLLQPPNPFVMPFLGKTGGSNDGYYGNPFGPTMPYPGSPLANMIPVSPVGPGSPYRHGERSIRFPCSLTNFAGDFMGSWHSETNGNLGGSIPMSLLEEFKSNKNKYYELSGIAGHIVEFSADQYGSRFIQQKLETAATEEKGMVFEEIRPQAFSLMTDVFGNYVIQKFFEHGSTTQIRELAEQLTGHVLTLSLQMYGCRVIQKAIEVVDLDQKSKMVGELEGHVMRCVRDQNGNHVIQKCIECVPQDVIHFIISSFYDQVVTLSTHPYGCRVMQRVLEHCDDPKTQQVMMDEIMASVGMLAQDQYGNYVVQHVLEHGKPHERCAIIKKLAGQIVQMSQQKFASNVVEKCLTYGGPIERQILVNEMLGTTDENQPLQAMMKDQFANYVVQKVLETCDDHQRELILSRVKVHLNALKKYTYGKHIVARVEKLVAAGERRIGIQSS